ncbi:Serine/threonine-protein phosphatase 7 long form homolog [Linum perenne]
MARLTYAQEFKGVFPDDMLITAMTERWRPETSTFHLPFGECTITLEDIAYVTGLPVDGEVVTRPFHRSRASYSGVCLAHHHQIVHQVPSRTAG